MLIAGTEGRWHVCDTTNQFNTFKPLCNAKTFYADATMPSGSEMIDDIDYSCVNCEECKSLLMEFDRIPVSLDDGNLYYSAVSYEKMVETEASMVFYETRLSIIHAFVLNYLEPDFLKSNRSWRRDGAINKKLNKIIMEDFMYDIFRCVVVSSNNGIVLVVGDLGNEYFYSYEVMFTSSAIVFSSSNSIEVEAYCEDWDCEDATVESFANDYYPRGQGFMDSELKFINGLMIAHKSMDIRPYYGEKLPYNRDLLRSQSINSNEINGVYLMGNKIPIVYNGATRSTPSVSSALSNVSYGIVTRDPLPILLNSTSSSGQYKKATAALRNRIGQNGLRNYMYQQYIGCDVVAGCFHGYNTLIGNTLAYDIEDQPMRYSGYSIVVAVRHTMNGRCEVRQASDISELTLGSVIVFSGHLMMSSNPLEMNSYNSISSNLYNDSALMQFVNHEKVREARYYNSRNYTDYIIVFIDKGRVQILHCDTVSAHDKVAYLKENNITYGLYIVSKGFCKRAIAACSISLFDVKEEK